MMKNIKLTAFILLAVLLTSSCKSQSRKMSANPPSYTVWNNLLHQYVNDEGWVNYEGFIRDSVKFNNFLHQLSTHAPNPKKWTKNERMAFWINAYNAFTIKLIIQHYPVKSIKDIGPAIQIPHVNTPWQIKFFSIGGEKMKLDEIENDILRKKFDDPRVHFSLVCAARSCPPLRNEAYTAKKLNEQLNSQGKKFLSESSKNVIAPDKIKISPIFKWYKGDFTKKQSLISFLNQFSPTHINPNASISHTDYSWDLNKQ